MQLSDFRSSSFSLKVALTYLVTGVLWVVCTDLLASLALPGPERLGITALSIGKGLTFVVASTTLIYLLTSAGTRKLETTLRSLKDSEQRFRLALGVSRESVWERDLTTGRIQFSPGFAELLGCDLEDLSPDGEHWFDHIHPEDRARARAALAAHLAGESPDFFSTHRLLRSDGTAVWVLSRGRLVSEPFGPSRRMIGSDLDITDRKYLEDELNRSNRALTALASGNRALVASSNRHGLFFGVCRALVEDAHYPLVWIGQPLNDDARGILVAASHGDSSGYLDGIKVSWSADEPEGRGPAGFAIRLGQTIFSRDMSTDSRCEPWRERGIAAGLLSAVAIPVFHNGAVVAVVNIHAKEKDAFDDREAAILETLAMDLGYAMAALDKVQRLEALQRGEAPAMSPGQPAQARADVVDRAPILALSRVKHVLIDSITALSLAVEKRDPYTAGHEIRTAALAVEIGRCLALDNDRVEGIRVGALMHDIGKIGIPVEILSKPARLTRQEFDLIKCHPETGFEIVQNIDFPWPVHRIVHDHHERLDGSGYPRALVGEQICLEARIVGVADVVEAMISHRPYRPGLGLDAALAEIDGNRGRLYDPAVVDACLTILRDGAFAFPMRLKQGQGAGC